MAPRYKIILTEDERNLLNNITRSGKHSAKKVIKARALLLCDTGVHEPAQKVADVAAALGITARTIEHLKKRVIEEGVEKALESKKPQTPRPKKFDGEFEAKLIALACSQAPNGYARWTLQLLADKAVELNLTSSISDMSVHRILKKMNLNLI